MLVTGIVLSWSVKRFHKKNKVTLYFKMSLLYMLHVLTIIITINYAELHASNPKPNPNPNPNHVVSTLILLST